MAGRYHGCQEYQLSEIGWLVEVPVDWHLYRMDDLTDTVRNQIDPSALGAMTVTHYSIPSVQEFGVGLVEEGETIDSNKFIVTEGDVLFSKLNPRKETIAIVQSHAEEIVSSTEFVVLRPKYKADARFIKYLLHAQALKSFICSQVESATKSHQRVNPSVVSKLKFYAPGLEAARSVIANFLDHETAKIDTLIDKQQQLIKLLKEKRQAVISHAVTKGLNPAAPMKESGIEWLGKVPEHWVVTPVRYVTNEVTVGIVVTPAKYYVDEGVPCFRSLNIKENQLNESDFVYISANSNDDLSKSKIFEDDILIVRTGQPGTAAVVNTKYDGVNCIDLIVLRKNNIFDSKYICYQINSDVCKRQISAGSGGAIQQHFNVETAKGLFVTLPPIEEQKLITEYIKKQCMKYEELINNAERFVLLSRERRTALISAAVTGKIDVRNWQPAQTNIPMEASP